MSIVPLLSSSLGERSEKANVELAKRLVKEKDIESVNELVALLHEGTKALKHDSIKVLYEVGEQDPLLISPYLSVFLDLLKVSDNRLQWGAMAAIRSFARIDSGPVKKFLAQILLAMDHGSVITRDNGMRILIGLMEVGNDDFLGELLLDELKKAPENQLPMYAEESFEVLKKNFQEEFKRVLLSRVQEMTKETKKRRVEKILKKL